MTSMLEAAHTNMASAVVSNASAEAGRSGASPFEAVKVKNEPNYDTVRQTLRDVIR